MSDLALIAADTSAIDAHSDPAKFVELACERAKEWLTQALEHGDIDQIVELKSQAEAVRAYTAQKQLGKDTELAAQEIVRRAERGLGICIRRGQAEGTVLVKGETVTRSNQWTRSAPLHVVEKSRSSDYFSNSAEATDAYTMVDDVTDELFDAAIAEAKEDGNLSRANVARTVTRQKIEGPSTLPGRIAKARQMADEGHTTDQIAEVLSLGHAGARRFLDRHNIKVHADVVVKGIRRVDSTRIVASTIAALDGIDTMFDRIDYVALDVTDLDHWVTTLNQAIKSLTTLRNRLKEINQ